MSLTIGELVGFIRLDASGVNTGATLAEARAAAAARAIQAAGQRIENERFAARLDLEIGNLERNLDQARRDLAEIEARPAEARVDGDTNDAELAIARLQHQLAQLNNQRIRVRAQVDDEGSAGRTRAELAKVGSEAANTASKVLAIGGGIPVILGLAAALASAAAAAALLPALLGAAGAGIGTLVVGFGGIGDALGALGAKDQASAGASSGAGAQREAAMERVRAATDALAAAQEQAQRNEIQSGWQLADAAAAVAEAISRADDVAAQGARQVAEARQAAADAVVQAAARVESAEDSLARAQQSSVDAQEALNRARVDAKEAIEDLSLALSGAALSEEAANLRLLRAQDDLKRAARKGTGSLAYREAELGVRQAEQAVAEAKDKYGDLAAESAHANAVGVDGADNVVAAQRRVDDANASVLAADKALTAARVEGDRQVADSKARLALAIQDEAKANQQAAADIERAKEQQARTEQQVAWSRADADKRVTDAERELAKAIADSGKAAGGGAGGVDKYAQALAKLSPNARALVMELARLKPQWDAIQKDVQNRLFAGTAEEVRQLAGIYLPMLHDVLGTVADGYNRAFMAASNWAEQPAVADALGAAWGRVSLAVSIFAQSLQPILSILADLFVVGSEFLPGLAQGFTDGANAAAAFIHEAAQSGQLHDWIQQALDVIGQLWQILVNVGAIIGTVFGAGQDSGMTFLQMLVNITGAARDFVGWLSDTGILSTFFAIMSVGGPVLLGIAGALKIVSLGLGAFNTIMQGVRIAGLIAQFILWAVTTVVQGAIALGSMIATAIGYVVQWVIMAAGAMVNAVIMAAAWLVALGPVGWVIAIIIGLVALIIANWDSIVAWTTQAWQAVSDWVIQKVGEFVDWVKNTIATWVGYLQQQWNTLLAANDALWRAVGNAVQVAINFVMGIVNSLVDFWHSIPDRIGQALGSLGDIIGGAFHSAMNVAIDMVNWGIDRINGLISGINTVGSFVGVTLPLIPHIPRFHTGGVVPGPAGSEMLAILQAGETVIPARAVAQARADLARSRGGDGWSQPTGSGGPRFLMPVTINNPQAERSSDAIGRAGSVLAAIGPWGDE